MKQLLLICLMPLASVAVSRAQIIYVDAGKADNSGTGTSWATAKKDLQPAIILAASGEQVWVKAGIYKPTTTGGNKNISFTMKNGVEIYGGFIGTETLLSQRNEIYNLTILSGDLNGDDGADFANNGENSYRIIFNANINSTAILDGFTITGANSNDYGAGMYNDASSPTIRNTLFLSNNAANGGGAMYNKGSSAFPTITNCVFYKNRAVTGSAIFNRFSSSFISNCIFTDNTCEVEGVIYIEGQIKGESTTILNSSITSNHRSEGSAGITVYFADLLVQNCIFDNNEAD